MLTKIRKATDHLFTRIILILIAFSFVAAGAASFMGGNSSEDVIIFDKVSPVSMDEFRSSRYQEIENIQKQTGQNLSEEDIVNLGINRLITKKLINDRMLKYLAEYYDLDIGKKTIIEFLKKYSVFKNNSGEFDISVFKSVFHNSQRKEKEYLYAIRTDLINSILHNIFLGSFTPPKAMVNNIVDYMSELRNVDIVSIDLDRKPWGLYKQGPPTHKQIESFYNSNQSLFTAPELRSFEYIKIDKKFLSKSIKISENELKKFFEENKDDFPSGDYKSMKKQVKDALLKEKIENLNNEFSKKLEDDVSTGLTIGEIAKKYSIKIKKVENISFADMKSSTVPEYKNMIDSVFEMSDGELSYPIELSDQNEIILILLNKVDHSRQEPLNKETKSKIYSIFNKREIISVNIGQLEYFSRRYDPKKPNDDGKSINIIKNKSFTRGELLDSSKFPVELLNRIFTGKTDSPTKVVIDNGKAYFAYVKSVKLNSKKASEFKNNSEENFANAIKEGVFQELIIYLTKKNNMQIPQEKLNNPSG